MQNKKTKQLIIINILMAWGFHLTAAPDTREAIALQAPASQLTPAVGDDALCHFPPIIKKPLPGPKVPADRTQLQADEADMSKKGTTRFRGEVVVQRGESRIESDQADYLHATEELNAQGHVRFFLNDSLLVEGESAAINLRTNTGTIKQSRYRTTAKNANGTAKEFTIDGPNRVILQDATYTTCQPGDKDWELSASTITLDNESRQGTARHAVVDYMGVPFLYLPYIRFPIGDERLSGLLYPSFATSEQHGTEVAVPYYWNIAPHRDATITPHNMSKRGLMLETEFRYLNKQNTGQIALDYMDNDKTFGDSRQQLYVQHTGFETAGWSSSVDYKKVGDTQHLTDFGNTLGGTSTTYLTRQASATYNAPLWAFSTLVQDYQILSGEEPYKRQPQLTLDSRLQELDNELNFNVHSEWVRFDHDDQNELTADRLHIKPSLSLPLRGEATFLVPKISWHYARYDIRENASTTDEQPDLFVPTYSLDSGLFMERDTAFGKTPLLQTLEPRLFYVYTPFREQDTLPSFDNGKIDFSYNSLFQENTFSGVDRVGDTNQLTAALTTRLLRQDNGTELFSASLGRIYYYADRRIAGETFDSTDYVAQLSIRPIDHLSISTDLQWDPEKKETVFSTTRLLYKIDNQHLFSLSSRYRRDVSEYLDAGFVWRISPRWKFLASNQYDSVNKRTLESIFGIQYDSCCWGLRLITREYYNAASSSADQTDNAIYLTLELKGLSSFGQDNQAEPILQRSIYGYNQ